MNRTILAIDLDGTIVTKVGEIVEGAREAINALYKEGYYIIIWTCRDDATDVANYLIANGICFDKVNEHHPQLIDFFKNDTRKIAADIYIDDKQLGGLPSWPVIYRTVKAQSLRIQDRLLETFIPNGLKGSKETS